MNENLDIKKYIQTIYSLESSLYELKNLYQDLNHKINIYKKGLSILDTTVYNSDGTIDEVCTMANIHSLEESPFCHLKEEVSMPKLSWYFDLSTIVVLTIATVTLYVIFILFFFLMGFG